MEMIRSIRTSPQTARRVQTHEDHDGQAVRMVAKILRELLQQQRFTDLADLTEALKCRCAQLKIRGYSRLVPRACDLVASNRPLVSPAPRPRDVVRAESRPLSRREASALWATLSARFGGEVKTLPRMSSPRIAIDGPVRDVIDIESLIGGAH
jgi:hypothetical protein